MQRRACMHRIHRVGCKRQRRGVCANEGEAARAACRAIGLEAAARLSQHLL